ncbi:Cu(I)-responsive transcriptional regulator [Sneathiella limimaris]|uniref:Cu(I)-responsive transcriptional regulator n=1 Tax=Sneathiella limimaris TaxID=1964213 RepID=UPI00146EC0C1
MNIGKASKLSKLPAKTIRYYEDINLVVPARSENGYRDYSDEDVHCLTFLSSARKLGFSIEECRSLLSLYLDKNRTSREVKSLASRKIEEIDKRIAELTAMKSMLNTLVLSCHGDNRPDCPILETLAAVDTNQDQQL